MLTGNFRCLSGKTLLNTNSSFIYIAKLGFVLTVSSLNLTTHVWETSRLSASENEELCLCIRIDKFQVSDLKYSPLGLFIQRMGRCHFYQMLQTRCVPIYQKKTLLNHLRKKKTILS